MEILNQVILAGNLADQPTVSDAGGRQFIRGRLAQSWFYETQGRTVEHRQFIPLTFFGESSIAAKSFQKGDNIHVTGQLIRREARPRHDEPSIGREPTTIYEIHVIRAFRIASESKTEPSTVHQNEIRRVNDAKRTPTFLEESIRDWPV
jgi:single-stranded DNA-binding protein